jgi:hypothetical protein
MAIFNYNGVLAMEGRWLWENGIMSKKNYNVLTSVRKQITVLHRSSPGRPAIISYESLPYGIKEKVEQKLKESGDLPKTQAESSVIFFEQYIKPDTAAMLFFRQQEAEHKILPNKVTEYYNNAIILNAIQELLTRRIADRHARNKIGRKDAGLFTSILEDLKRLPTDKYPHTLPSSERNFRPRYKDYFSGTGRNYASLLHSNVGNQHARKVNKDVERLLLSLAIRSNNPYCEWVHNDYISFLYGDIELVDEKTGELFERENFRKENGEYITLSETTVWNYINAPRNRIVIDRVRMNHYKYRHLMRPHYERELPRYSLSKVSLDDRDLPRLLHNGKHVFAYYAYDVMSGALIGAAYSTKKDTQLFMNCLRDMYANLEEWGAGWPLEAEVEHHLTGQFVDNILYPGNLFAYVHYCAPTNSQEKYAEPMNRVKKYGSEKKRQDNIGRHYAKKLVNQTNGVRQYNDETAEYEYRLPRFTFEEIVSEDMKTIIEFNTQPYHGKKSRMEAFMENMNPEAVMDRRNICYWTGYSEKTTIRRNQYINLQYAKYWLPEVEVLKLLKPNDYEVTAYFMSGDDTAYIYQGERFICEVSKVEKFVNSQAEETEKDKAAMAEQSKYLSHYDKVVKEGVSELSNIRVLEKSKAMQKIEQEDAKNYTVKQDAIADKEIDIDDLIANYDSRQVQEIAIKAS